MCTVVAFDRMNEAFPLIVVGIRDEYYDRPSSQPLIIDLDPQVVAPMDLEAGGTWFGVRPDGFFAALTNQEDTVRMDRAPSRGHVVRNVLRAGSAWGVMCENPHAYNAYNMLHGRPGLLWLSTVYRGEVAMKQLDPGVHIVCNDEIGTSFNAKKDRLRSYAQFIDERTRSVAAILRFVRYMSSDHHLESVSPQLSTCVHDAEYGTRSVSVAICLADGSPPLFYHAEGPACEGQPFLDFSDLLL